MDSGRWEKIQGLFHEAAVLPEREWRTFLEGHCGGDAVLVSEVIALLDEDARGDSLLDGDVAHAANDILEQGVVASTSLPFTQFGPYRIERTLGEGGMGVVYLAAREDLGNRVAIKILRDAWLSPARRERFASEQRTLAQLNHSSIARLYDADTSPDGTPFFVMEYVEGEPLTTYCARRGCSIEARLRLFRGVCEAVLYAHQRAIIHRDLKPSNILVKDDGTVRLLDFGVAKHLEDLGNAAEQTGANLRLMTPAYAAPEQIRGEQAGIQGDVYSLGVILYEMLAGRLPFDLSNKTPAQAEKTLTEGEAAKPSSVAAERAAASKMAWADLDVLCLTAMHKDVQRRYQSVEAVLRDVDHYLKGEPLEARRDTPGYRLRKFVGRHVGTVAAAAAAFVIVVGLVVFFTVRLTIARNEALAEAARAQRLQKFTTDLFQGGDAEAGPADNLRVVTLLDRGVLDAESLSSEPEVQAGLYQTLGAIYQKLGKFDRAESLLNEALRVRKGLFGSDSAQVAESLVALGLLRDDQAQFPLAERLVTQGLEMSKRHLAASDPRIAQATAALGKVQEDHGSFNAAIGTLDEAVRLQTVKAGNATPDLAASLYELANAHFYAGHYDKAETLNQQLLPMYQKLYGPRHPRVADIYVNLGEIRTAQGHYKEAEKYDREALQIVEAWYGDENPQTAIDMTVLARALMYEKRYDEAREMLAQSLAIKERVFGDNHPSVASTLNELGNTASMQGNYAAAEEYYKRMGDIYRDVYGEHHYLYGVALSNVGSVYLGRHEWTKAEEIFRRVVAIFSESQGPAHVNTGIAQEKLGRALLREHRYTEAEVETRGGYEILTAQMDPQVSWLVSARKDLVEEYDALKQPQQAARFRAELAAPQNASATSSSKR